MTSSDHAEDLELVRQSTAEVMTGVEGWSDDYITQELLDDYERDATDDDSGEAVEGSEALWYYGNHLLWVPDRSQPGYVGRLYLTNGSNNRPNDPCGSLYRRRIWFYHSPRSSYSYNCGRFWGFGLANA